MKETIISFIKKNKRLVAGIAGGIAVFIIMIFVLVLSKEPTVAPDKSSTSVSNSSEIAWLLDNYQKSYEKGLLTKDQYDRIKAILNQCANNELILDNEVEKILASIAVEEVDATESVPDSTINETDPPSSIDSIETEEETTLEQTKPTQVPTTLEPTTAAPTDPPTLPPPDPRESVLDNYQILAVVTAPNYLNVREGPSKKYKIVGKLFKYSGVDLLEVTKDGQWYRISSNGVEGWINAGFIVTGEEARQLAIENAFPGIKVDTKTLNVRSDPWIAKNNIITQISRGAVFVVTGFEGEWIKIDLGSGDEGYVHSDYIEWNYMLTEAVPYEEPITIDPRRLELINFAMEYLGGRYVWGGTKLGVGVDCSGFTMRVFEHFGYDLERTAKYQALKNGVEVSFDQMRPGDLIFFWSTKRNMIGHVGIYIGNGLMVHAASETRGIVIDPYDYMTPLLAKDIIGD